MNQIKKLRQQKKFSQGRLGEMAGGISQQMVANYENGETPLTVPIAQKLAKALGVSPAEIMGLKHYTLKAEPGDFSLNNNAYAITLDVSAALHTRLESEGIKITPEKFKELVAGIYRVFAEQAKPEPAMLRNTVQLAVDGLKGRLR